MPRFCAAMLLALSLYSAAVFAQQSHTAKAMVERGLQAYLKGDASDAIKAWLKGGPLEANTYAANQATNLKQIEEAYGKPESFDILREHIIAPRARLVIFVVNYSKGILFGRLQAYQTKSGEWIATEFKFNTEAATILPNEGVYGR